MLPLCRSLTRRHQSIESFFDLAPDAGAVPRKVVGVVVAQCKEALDTGTAVVWALHAQHQSRGDLRAGWQARSNDQLGGSSNVHWKWVRDSWALLWFGPCMHSTGHERSLAN